MKRDQRTAGSIEIHVATKALQDFGKDQVTNKDGLFAQDSIQEIGLSGSSADEIVNPALGIP